MQNKGFVSVFAVLLALVCCYQISFSFAVRGVESEAKELAAAAGDETLEKYYLDSLTENWTWAGDTYKQAQEKQIGLGLDLKGGMNVILEISVSDVLKALAAENADDPTFVEAIQKTKAGDAVSGEEFLKAFAANFHAVNPNAKLAKVFSTYQLKDKIKKDTPDSEVLDIIQREMGLEFVNLGVSGEGKLVYAMARAMAGIEDAVAYVIDPVPNCTKMQCDTLTYTFISILRKLRPEVPIIMVEGPMYPYAKFDSFFGGYLPQKNEAYRKNYDLLKAEDPRNLYYVTCEGLTAENEEGTVDGIHLTDLGFRAYADKLEAVLREVFEDQYLQSSDAAREARKAAAEAAAAKPSKKRRK